jgi:hypothetical protein
MQPSPSADTSKPLLPSVRRCIVLLLRKAAELFYLSPDSRLIVGSYTIEGNSVVMDIS